MKSSPGSIMLLPNNSLSRLGIPSSINNVAPRGAPLHCPTLPFSHSSLDAWFEADDERVPRSRAIFLLRPNPPHRCCLRLVTDVWDYEIVCWRCECLCWSLDSSRDWASLIDSLEGAMQIVLRLRCCIQLRLAMIYLSAAWIAREVLQDKLRFLCILLRRLA